MAMYWETKPMMEDIAKKTTQGYSKFMEDMMKIYSGEMNPTQLPMFKTMIPNLETLFSKAEPNIMKEATARGIRGGTLGNILKSGQSDLMDKAVKAMYDMYSMAPQAIGEGFQFTSQLGQKEMQMLIDAYNQHRNRKLAAESAKMQGISSGVTGGCKSAGSGISSATGGGLANCMIFLTADCFTCNVKKFRDEYFSADSYVAKGYGKMAEWLVPVMLKHKTIKSLVRFLLYPLVVFADAYKENEKGLKALLYCPFGFLWTKIWDIYGRI